MDTKSNPTIIQAAKNADLLVHESTYDGKSAVMARKHGHSTSVQAAENAKKAQAKHLVLTHISARYLGKSADTLLEEARSVFKNTDLAHDFAVFTIPVKSADNKKLVKAHAW